MEKDVELRGWKAHCVYLQDKCERLELENSRLKAAIDEANAQEPISNVDVYYDSNDSGERILTCETFGSNFKSLGVGKHKLYARPIPAQKSQAVAMPAKTETIAKELSHASVYLYSYVEQLECILSTSSPRITEQDAREIVFAFNAWENFDGGAPTADGFAGSIECKSLINKLNEAKNHGN